MCGWRLASPACVCARVKLGHTVRGSWYRSPLPPLGSCLFSDASELEIVNDWRNQQIAAIAVATVNKPGTGIFVDTCYVHEQNVRQRQQQRLLLLYRLAGPPVHDTAPPPPCAHAHVQVDYCSGQSLPNCRGWNIYKVSSPAFPIADVTPQQVRCEADRGGRGGRCQWRRRLDATRPVSVSRCYPPTYAPPCSPRARTLARTQAFTLWYAGANNGSVQIIDPSEWGANPSCPYPGPLRAGGGSTLYVPPWMKQQ